jgi:glycerate kinase
VKKSNKIVLAPDSFKGSLTAVQVCEALAAGIKKADNSIEVIKIPLSDGGEGFTESLLTAVGGQKIACEVLDPLGRQISAGYAVLPDQTVIVETAVASGLSLIKAEERNPLEATSFGSGQLIRAALEAGRRKIVIGLGGSATVDGGAGLVQALGVKFFDKASRLIDRPMTNALLENCGSIDPSGLLSAIRKATFVIASDVTNPLLGKKGAVAVYAPQKGAAPEILPRLENNLVHFNNLVEAQTGRTVRDVPGAGAAGGLGAGLLAFLNARIRSGIEMVLELTDFRQRLAEADLIITGEGRIDEQTVFGKTIAGVLQGAAEKQIPVIAVAGQKRGNLIELHQRGLREIYTLAERVSTPQEAFGRAEELLKEIGNEIAGRYTACPGKREK